MLLAQIYLPAGAGPGRRRVLGATESIDAVGGVNVVLVLRLGVAVFAIASRRRLDGRNFARRGARPHDVARIDVCGWRLQVIMLQEQLRRGAGNHRAVSLIEGQEAIQYGIIAAR